MAHCTYNVYGCSDPTATNYQSHVPTTAGNKWEVNSEMCQYAGCNDTEATNWDAKVSGSRSCWNCTASQPARALTEIAGALDENTRETAFIRSGARALGRGGWGGA